MQEDKLNIENKIICKKLNLLQLLIDTDEKFF